MATQEGTYLLQSVSGGGFISISDTGEPYLAYNKHPNKSILYWQLEKTGGSWHLRTEIKNVSYFLYGADYYPTTSREGTTDKEKWVIEAVEDEKYRAIKNVKSGGYLDGRNPLMSELLVTRREAYNDAYLQWNLLRVERQGDEMRIVQGELIDLSIPEKSEFPVDAGNYLIRSKSGGGYLCPGEEQNAFIDYTEDAYNIKKLHWQVLPSGETGYWTIQSVTSLEYLGNRWGGPVLYNETMGDITKWAVENVHPENYCAIGNKNGPAYLDGRNPGMSQLLLTSREPYRDGYLQWELVPIVSHVKSARK